VTVWCLSQSPGNRVDFSSLAFGGDFVVLPFLAAFAAKTDLEALSSLSPNLLDLYPLLRTLLRPPIPGHLYLWFLSVVMHIFRGKGDSVP
jgi:hypothetical protein